MKRIVFLGLILGVSLKLSENSPCVLATPSNPQDCYSKETEKMQQTCCYFYGKYKDINSDNFVTGPACLEAYKSDVNRVKTKQKLKKK